MQEVEALEELSDALSALVRSNALKYMQAEVIHRTILASLMTSLAPLAWTEIGQIIGRILLIFSYDNH
jgi:hypothetical protein